MVCENRGRSHPNLPGHITRPMMRARNGAECSAKRARFPSPRVLSIDPTQFPHRGVSSVFVRGYPREGNEPSTLNFESSCLKFQRASSSDVRTNVRSIRSLENLRTESLVWRQISPDNRKWPFSWAMARSIISRPSSDPAKLDRPVRCARESDRTRDPTCQNGVCASRRETLVPRIPGTEPTRTQASSRSLPARLTDEKGSASKSSTA